MGVEIERKFLVTGDGWRRAAGPGVAMRQGYIVREARVSVRVRLASGAGYLTIKGKAAPGSIARSEFEYEVPAAEAEALLSTLCLPAAIDKVRYEVPFGGHTWEVDVFAGANAPLVLAELELSRADEPFARPPWVGREVSEDPRFLNANLSANPYSSWPNPPSLGDL
jgi:adenylate cyclase